MLDSSFNYQVINKDKLLNRIQTENLSVRQVEQILQKTKKISKKEKDHFVKEEEQTLKKYSD